MACCQSSYVCSTNFARVAMVTIKKARAGFTIFFFFFFLKRDWVWKDPLEDSNSVTLPVSGGGGNQGWNGGGMLSKSRVRGRK